MLKTKSIVLDGERIRLRSLTIDDLPMTLNWRNQDSIRIWFFSSNRINQEQHRSWFDAYQRKATDFVFIIEEKEPSLNPIGQASIYNINKNKKQAEFGRLMIGDPVARGKGYAKESTNLLLKFAKKDLGLKEIFLEVFEKNLPAIACYQACGFFESSKKDGILHMVHPL